MLSTILLYALGGYFGTPSPQLSSWLSKAQFDPDQPWGPNPGPNDGPLKVPIIKWPPRPPIWWWAGAGIIGGLAGGFIVNYGLSNDAALGVAGAVFGGRALSDAVNSFSA
jgi:hypothetical protein